LKSNFNKPRVSRRQRLHSRVSALRTADAGSGGESASSKLISWFCRSFELKKSGQGDSTYSWL